MIKQTLTNHCIFQVPVSRSPRADSGFFGKAAPKNVRLALRRGIQNQFYFMYGQCVSTSSNLTTKGIQFQVNYQTFNGKRRFCCRWYPRLCGLDLYNTLDAHWARDFGRCAAGANNYFNRDLAVETTVEQVCSVGKCPDTCWCQMWCSISVVWWAHCFLDFHHGSLSYLLSGIITHMHSLKWSTCKERMKTHNSQQWPSHGCVVAVHVPARLQDQLFWSVGKWSPSYILYFFNLCREHIQEESCIRLSIKRHKTISPYCRWLRTTFWFEAYEAWNCGSLVSYSPSGPGWNDVGLWHCILVFIRRRAGAGGVGTPFVCTKIASSSAIGDQNFITHWYATSTSSMHAVLWRYSWWFTCAITFQLEATRNFPRFPVSQGHPFTFSAFGWGKWPFFMTGLLCFSAVAFKLFTSLQQQAMFVGPCCGGRAFCWGKLC